MTIKDLQPKIVWDNFYGITRQPRPSKHEEKIRAWLLDWAKQRNIEAFADETGNVIMRKPATPGMENLKGSPLRPHPTSEACLSVCIIKSARGPDH